MRGGWDRARTVVDVGGGTGAMLAEVLATAERSRDARRSSKDSGALVQNFQAARVADRVSTVGQSFFDPPPPEATCAC